jgi:hypothetical protein
MNGVAHETAGAKQPMSLLDAEVVPPGRVERQRVFDLGQVFAEMGLNPQTGMLGCEGACRFHLLQRRGDRVLEPCQRAISAFVSS